MKKNRKLAERWLRQAIRFSESADPETYVWLVEWASKFNIYCNTDGSKGEDHVMLSAKAIAHFFNTMSGQDNSKASKKKRMLVRPAYTFMIYKTDAPDGPHIEYFYNDDVDGSVRESLAAAMMQIMSLHGIRSIGKCESKHCENITFTNRSKPKATCSDRCRQQALRDSRKEPKTKGGK